jgi:hypothetical protein
MGVNLTRKMFGRVGPSPGLGAYIGTFRTFALESSLLVVAFRAAEPGGRAAGGLAEYDTPGPVWTAPSTSTGPCSSRLDLRVKFNKHFKFLLVSVLTPVESSGVLGFWNHDCENLSDPPRGVILSKYCKA